MVHFQTLDDVTRRRKHAWWPDGLSCERVRREKAREGKNRREKKAIGEKRQRKQEEQDASRIVDSLRRLRSTMCVRIAFLSLPCPLFSPSAHSLSQRVEKVSPFLLLFFLPKCGNDISVCLLRSQQTGRWSIFLRCPLFLYS